MKITQLAARMFDTYGMEDILLNSFKRHHKDFLIANKNEISDKQKLLEDGKSIVIGSMRIGNLLQQIIEKHGMPPKEGYPNLVTFMLVHPNSNFVKNRTMAGFFWRSTENKIYIARVVTDITNEPSDKEMLFLLQHELQHLIRKMYTSKINRSKMHTPEFYAQQNELQAFCAGLAKVSIEAWIDVNEYAFRNLAPEKILLKIDEWRQPIRIYSAFNLFVMNRFLGAFKQFDDVRNKIISSNPELKKKYLYYTFRNFETMMNRYLDELENKIRNKIDTK